MNKMMDSGIVLSTDVRFRIIIHRCDGSIQDFSNVVNVINNDSVMAVITESKIHYFRLKFLREWVVEKEEGNKNGNDN